MMTIQTQNPVLTEPFRKTKGFGIRNVIVILTALLILGMVIYFCFSQDGYSAKVYDDPESVEKLFISNREPFVEIASILKDSELFSYLYSIDRNSIFGPSIPERKKYLNDEEYQHICVFLNEYQPYEIGRTQGNLHFVFLCKNYDVTLYYIELEGEDLSDFLRYVGQYSDLKAIGDNWYIRVRSSDIVR